jgi:hypothetical protein
VKRTLDLTVSRTMQASSSSDPATSDASSNASAKWPKVPCPRSFDGYPTCMSTEKDERQPFDDRRELWSEALWGLGLIGAVLILVTLIAATLGR